MKSVLVMAGSLKRGYPEVDEDLTLIRALVDSNVPKFLADDLPLFAAIVKVIVIVKVKGKVISALYTQRAFEVPRMLVAYPNVLGPSLRLTIVIYFARGHCSAPCPSLCRRPSRVCHARCTTHALQDLFPGLEVPSNDYGEFSVELGDQLDKHGLQKVNEMPKHYPPA